MNEINKLVWPTAAGGIGVMNAAAFARTASIAKQFGVIKKAPSGAYRTDLATKAIASLKVAGDRRLRQELEAGRREAHRRRQVSSVTHSTPGAARQGGPGVLESDTAEKEAKPMSVLIKGGRVITAADDYVADVFIEGERISLIGESLDVAADKVIDASGKYVLPGAVDPHTHLEMPWRGKTTVDDFYHGSRRGGVRRDDDARRLLHPGARADVRRGARDLARRSARARR